MEKSLSPRDAISIRSKTWSWGWSLAAIVVIAFGVMAVEFSSALRADRPGWWADIQAGLAGADYTLGTGSAAQMYPVYLAAVRSMSVHTMLGGGALMLAVLQFVPTLRRRHPLLHRGAGGLVIVAVIASMAGSLSYLAQTPLVKIYASPGFGLSLWALALATLAYTALAIAAIRRRDFRSHMGFMALMMANLLTAPVLRFEWALFGMLTPLDMSAVNQGATVFLGLTTILMMTLWMDRIGNSDLPARPRAPVLAPRTLRGLSVLALLTIAHEAILAPLGVDLLAGWRAAASLPVAAVAWALPAMALAWRAPREIAAATAGARVTSASQILAVLAAVGALLTAWWQPRVDVDATGMVFYWVALGAGTLMLLAGAAAARPRAEPWSLFWLLLALVPAAWPPLALVAAAAGQSATVALWFACTVGSSAFAAVAFMTAYAVRLPGRAATP